MGSFRRSNSYGGLRQRKRRGEAPSIGDAAGRQHGNRSNGVDDHGNQRHGGLPADVPAALGALGDDDIGTGRRRPHRLGHAARHERDLATRAMGAANVGFHILFGPRRMQRRTASARRVSSCRFMPAAALPLQSREFCWPAMAAASR